MFSYFKIEEGEEKYSAPYQKRLEKRTTEICNGSDCKKNDTLNLLTLAQMSTPIEDLKIDQIDMISKYTKDYFNFIKARFFKGMEIDDFLCDHETMEEFEEIKTRIKWQLLNDTERTFKYLVPYNNESYQNYCKRIHEEINSKQSKEYLNIEKSWVLEHELASSLLLDSPCDVMLDEEIMNLLALEKAISKSGLGGKIMGEFNKHLSRLLGQGLSLFESFIIIYGYYLMADNDLYEILINEKKWIYKVFGNAYNSGIRNYNFLRNDIVEDFSLEDEYSEYDELPEKEKIIKPNNKRGVYGGYYALPDKMKQITSSKEISKEFADYIIEAGFDDAYKDIRYFVDSFKDTEKEDEIKQGIKGISKELRRKTRVSKKQMEDIEKKLKGIL